MLNPDITTVKIDDIKEKIMGFRVDNNLEQWVHINANYTRQSSPGYAKNEREEFYRPETNIVKSNHVHM